MQIVLCSERTRAVVDLHGATVVSWTVDDVERLYVSPNAVRRHGKGIRGGVPLCVPWFAAHPHHPEWPSHGVARGREWRVVEQSEARLLAELVSDEETLQVWPHAFRFEVEVALEEGLRMVFRHHNTDATPVEVTGALHTYLRVPSWNDVQIRGLEGSRAFDKLTGDTLQPAHAVLPIDGPIDRLFFTTPEHLELHHSEGSVRVQSSAPDAVVWNPGAAAAAGMADLGEGEHRFFVCLEAASLQPVVVPPGETWTLEQHLVVG